MSSIQQVSFDASKPQALQLKSRYEYFSHGLTTLNRLQTIAPNRPVIATALKVMFAVPALIADVVRNLAAALANLALSLANLGIALQNMTHKLLHARHVQPMPQPVIAQPVIEESKSEFVLTEKSFEKSGSVATNVEEEIIFGKSETLSTSSSATRSSSSTIESEEEFTEEAQSEAQSAQWITANRVIGASVVAGLVALGGAYYSYDCSNQNCATDLYNYLASFISNPADPESKDL